jgi:hypothetical protein
MNGAKSPLKIKNIITIILFVLVVLVPAVLVFGIFFFGPELSHLLSGG